MSHPRRRTAVLRTAVVSVLAGGALLVPATGALADTGSPTPSAPVSVSPGKTSSPDETATPKGGVRAGTDGLRDAGDPAFLVAGGAMAAAGAAGLGFAMLRRGRTDD
ncbi:hypothetical protein RB200_27400 [Streptomyces sp. PmtG]